MNDKDENYLSDTCFNAVLLHSSFHERADDSLGTAVQKLLSADRDGPDESIAGCNEPMFHEHGLLVPVDNLRKK